DGARAAWTRNGVAATTATGSQGLPQIVTDGAGGAYVGWRDVATNTFRLTHLDSNGDVAAPWPLDGIMVVSARSFDAGLLESDGAGGALVGAVVYDQAFTVHVNADTTRSASSTAPCGQYFVAGSTGEPGELLYSYFAGGCGNTSYIMTDRFGPTGVR